jgi:NADH:ubiquinone oxidoreductase subunit E
LSDRAGVAYSEITHKQGERLLENEATLEIQHLIRDFKPQDGDLLGALHAVQHRYGYIPKMAMPVVARQLRLSEAMVYGAVTYYSEFRTIPPPRTLIGWCSGPACKLKGSDHVRRVLEAELGIGMGQNTGGDALGLHFAQCNGTCEYAPQIWVNGKVTGPLTASETVRLVRELKDEA